jgi:hypothetical protein
LVDGQDVHGISRPAANIRPWPMMACTGLRRPTRSPLGLPA